MGIVAIRNLVGSFFWRLSLWEVKSLLGLVVKVESVLTIVFRFIQYLIVFEFFFLEFLWLFGGNLEGCVRFIGWSRIVGLMGFVGLLYRWCLGLFGCACGWNLGVNFRIRFELRRRRIFWIVGGFWSTSCVYCRLCRYFVGNFWRVFCGGWGRRGRNRRLGRRRGLFVLLCFFCLRSLRIFFSSWGENSKSSHCRSSSSS